MRSEDVFESLLVQELLDKRLGSSTLGRLRHGLSVDWFVTESCENG